jgi:putative transposase
VNTFKRDCVSRIDIVDARTVMAQMAAAFEHFNEVHPHSALKMKSPREYRQHRAAQQRLAQTDQALHCE